MASHVTQDVREDDESDPNHYLSEAGKTSDVNESEPQPFAVEEISDVFKPHPEQSSVGINSDADEAESPPLRAENTSDESEGKRQSQATLNLCKINECFSQLLKFDNESDVGDIQPIHQPVTAGKINTGCEAVPQNNGKTSDMKEHQTQPSNDVSERKHQSSVTLIASDVSEDIPETSVDTGVVYKSESEPPYVEKTLDVGKTRTQPPASVLTTDVNETKYKLSPVWKIDVVKKVKLQPTGSVKNSDVGATETQIAEASLENVTEIKPEISTAFELESNVCDKQKQATLITSDVSEDPLQPSVTSGVRHESEPQSSLVEKTSDIGEAKSQPSASVITTDVNQPEHQLSATCSIQSSPIIIQPAGSRKDSYVYETETELAEAGNTSDVNELKPEIPKDVDSNKVSEPTPQPSEARTNSDVRDFIVQPPMDVFSTTYEGEPKPQQSGAGENSDLRIPNLQPPTGIITTDKSEPTPQPWGAENTSDEDQPKLQPTADVITNESEPTSKPLVARKTNDIEEPEPKTSTDAMTIASEGNPQPSATGNASDVRVVDERSDPSISLQDEQRRLQQDLGCPVYIIGKAMLMSRLHMKYDLKTVNFNVVHIDKNGLLWNIPGKGNSDDTNGRFQNYWGTTSTDPLHQTGLPQYLEVLTNVWIDKPFGENRLILDIGVCGQGNRDVLYSTPSRQYCYCLQVARWPGENNVGTRVGKEGKVVHHVSDTLPNTVDSHTTLHYGVVYDPTRKVIVFIDVKEMKIIKVLNNLNFEEPMWPLFGVYAPGFAEISMELIAGDDIDITNEKEELILKAL